MNLGWGLAWALIVAGCSSAVGSQSTQQVRTVDTDQMVTGLTMNVAGAVVIVGGRVVAQSSRLVTLDSVGENRDVRVLFDRKRVTELSTTTMALGGAVSASLSWNLDPSKFDFDEAGHAPSNPVGEWESIRAASARIDLNADGTQTILLCDVLTDGSTDPITYVTMTGTR